MHGGSRRTLHLAAIGSLLAAALLAIGVACSDDGSAVLTADAWSDLRRPMTLPSLESGQSCPVTSSSIVSGAYGAAHGPGPIYPIGLAEVTLEEVERAGQWVNLKTLWVSDDSYDGPVLIRGGQIDGVAELRFADAATPTLELKLPAEAWATSPRADPGWREWPSYTRIQSAGCYAFQVDGREFSYAVIFRAAACAAC